MRIGVAVATILVLEAEATGHHHRLRTVMSHEYHLLLPLLGLQEHLLLFTCRYENLGQIFVLHALKLNLTYVRKISVFDSVLVNDLDLKTSLLLNLARSRRSLADVAFLLVLSKLSQLA